MRDDVVLNPDCFSAPPFITDERCSILLGRPSLDRPSDSTIGRRPSEQCRASPTFNIRRGRKADAIDPADLLSLFGKSRKEARSAARDRTITTPKLTEHHPVVGAQESSLPTMFLARVCPTYHCGPRPDRETRGLAARGSPHARAPVRCDRARRTGLRGSPAAAGRREAVRVATGTPHAPVRCAAPMPGLLRPIGVAGGLGGRPLTGSCATPTPSSAASRSATTSSVTRRGSCGTRRSHRRALRDTTRVAGLAGRCLDWAAPPSLPARPQESGPRGREDVPRAGR